MSRFVLVHGLCHGGWCWEPTATELVALGDDVSHIVYVAALMIGADDVAGARVAEFPPTLFNQRFEVSEDGLITVDSESAVECFYNECTNTVARAAAARLRPASVDCLRTPTGAEPWNEIPSTYVVCGRDRTIHPDMQRAMAARAGRVHSIDTDHSPFMSASSELLQILIRAAEES